LTRLVEFARKQQAQMEHESRLQAALAEVQAHLNANRFMDAATAARDALEVFPGNARFTALLEQAQAGEKKEIVRKLIERRIREIKVKINRGDLSDAKAMAREALTTLGPDTDVNQLLASAEVEYEAREKKKKQEQQLENIRSLIQSGKNDEAATKLDEVMKAGDFHVLDPRLYQVADEIEAARGAAAASTVAATAAEPPDEAREYAVLEGPPAGAQAAPMAAPPTMQQSPGAGHQEDTLWAAERQLATFIGPVAKIVVKKAASKAKNAEELYTLLSQNLEREADRQVFLAKGAEVSRQQEQRPVWAEPAAAAAAVSQPPAARGELTRESIDRAAAMLARYIGPISSVLAKKAAQRANSVSALYQLLADHVESKGDRARFLKEAGVRERE
jgi:hypothetical protein